MTLTEYDKMPEMDTFDKYCYIDFTTPHTITSHTTIRSLATTSDDKPEKCVKYLGRHEYKVEMDFTTEVETKAYLAATKQKEPEPEPEPIKEEPDSDDSW